MPESTVEIRNPGEIDLTQYRVEIGDTIEFVEKINGTQADLENWAEELTFCAIDMQSAADQIGTRYISILQAGVQVGQDKQTVTQLKNDVTTLKEQSETAAQTATEQAGIAEGAATVAVTQAGLAEDAKVLAVAAVAALPPGTINDLITSENYAWSSAKIESIRTVSLAVSIAAPAQVPATGSFTATITGTSSLVNGNIAGFEAAWWDGSTEYATASGGSAEFSKPVDQPVGGEVSITVYAVDELGNRSRHKTATAEVVANQPPVGPITINHASVVSKGGSFDLALSGATDPDGDDALIRYEITDPGILSFAKTTDITAGELVAVTAPDVAVDTVATFSVAAYDEMGLATEPKNSSVNIIVASVIGVKLVETGGNGGTWAHIDDTGAEIATPSESWFNAHPVFGGIVDQVIDGQAMVKVPKFYYRRGLAQIVVPEASAKPAWYISDQQVSGFETFPAFILDSVEKDQFWYGKYQASESGGKLQSIPGVLPKVSISLTQSLAMAEARNVGGVEGFRLHHYDMWLAIQWLYLVENATMDSQTKTGQGRVSASSAANVDASDVAQATYRGIVGLWGNVYQWMDGVRTKNNLIERRAYNGAWASTGQSAMGNTYPITFRSTAADSFLPDTFATSNTNATLPDQVYWLNQANTTEYYPYVGGHWDQAAYAGLWRVNCTSAASSAVTFIGARLARIV